MVVPIGIFVQTLEDEGLEFGGYARVQCARDHRRLVKDRIDEPRSLLFRVCPPGGGHLVEHSTDRIDVRASIHRLASELLRRHNNGRCEADLLAQFQSIMEDQEP